MKTILPYSHPTLLLATRIPWMALAVRTPRKRTVRSNNFFLSYYSHALFRVACAVAEGWQRDVGS